VPVGNAFTTAASLRAVVKNYSAATAVGIWNSLIGVTPVRKFKDAATAARRIFAEVQKLGGPESLAAQSLLKPGRCAGNKARPRRPVPNR
jgi:hypothetical protein